MIAYRIDRRSGIPTYVQLILQTKQALRLGSLTVGDKLPTAKDVVTALAINPNTVLKAYRELEREGLVEPRTGSGTFVVASLAKPGMAERSALEAELGRWIRHCLAAGLDRPDLEAIVTAALDTQFDRPEGSDS
ncbi:GntR family transcriptional regulator [Rhodococcus sp. 05-340-1]|jgi:GntR family transcriptional regulator|uniref:GntR family transcriptional regulator n=1 Tax=Nocardiaceae TaxID=85025 RepID=UPI00056D4D92|nr:MULTISPECIES: GntR family transcriptional regulator [Rhodococcus]OZD61137.1 GntR family transcriptional regulator [Rhodococcus sp. 05-340-2]OZD82359.1 GntR family transcriptional regulator [Rhodococcus sp. 05-340-1]OZE97333.1 GntR family transcriptional regulator [Rhodococcus sp. 15-2388-1-1a]OZF28811.1 GntR family transcriptional regulator [Rhodococcus sp. 14-2483-1-2]